MMTRGSHRNRRMFQTEEKVSVEALSQEEAYQVRGIKRRAVWLKPSKQVQERDQGQIIWGLVSHGKSWVTVGSYWRVLGRL